MKQLIKLFDKTEFPVDIDWNSTSKYNTLKAGGYFIGFVVHYDIGHYNCLEATYDNPSEHSSRVTITDITDMEIMKLNNPDKYGLDIPDDVWEECLNIIKQKAYYE